MVLEQTSEKFTNPPSALTRTVKEILSRHVSFVREKSAGPTRGHSCHSPRTEPGSNPPHCGPSLSRGQSSSPRLGFSGRAPGRSSAAGKKRRPTRRNPVPSRAPQEARQAPEHPSFRQRLPGPPPPRGGPLRTLSERGGLPRTLGRGAVDPASVSSSSPDAVRCLLWFRRWHRVC